MNRARGTLAVLLATCLVAIGATVASAQTVIVRHAAPGATVELVLGVTPAGTAKVDTGGLATVTATTTLDMPIDANVWVETCSNAYRVIVARRGMSLTADFACTRTQIAGLFSVQGITSIVVDVRGTPSLLLRQGPAPDTWLRDPVPSNAGAGASTSGPATPLPPLTGLALFGGAGRGATLNFKSQSCGNVASCSNNSPTPYSGGLVWWFNDFVGAEARYSSDLGTLEAEGSDAPFRFTTTREGGALSFSARAGFRKGRVRPFGRGGMSLHRATLTTTQTVDDTTVVIDGVTQTVPGGTQVLQMRTKGWAPVYGGGVEVWLSPRFGIYGEAQRIGLKGTDDRDSGIDIDDALITVQGGVTVRFP